MQLKQIHNYSFLLIGICLTFLGCASSSEPSKYYILQSMADSGCVADGTTPLSDFSIGLGPVEISEYLKRPTIAIRKSSNEMDLAEFHQWAEPLENNISRVLADNLSILLKNRRVEMFPWQGDERIDYQVIIKVLRFDSDDSGKSHLFARWSILKNKEMKNLGEMISRFIEPVDGSKYTSRVAAMNQNLIKLSRTIAERLNNLVIPKS